jgi:hypothetical protein
VQVLKQGMQKILQKARVQRHIGRIRSSGEPASRIIDLKWPTTAW